MEARTINLYQADDSEQSFAIKLAEDPPERWRAQSGFGRHFKKAWNIEFQSGSVPADHLINWEAVLERSVEAFGLSDPVITNWEWPQLELT